MGMYEAIKDGFDVVRASDNVPLLKNFMDIQQGYMQMQKELEQANQKIEELSKQLELKGKLIFQDNMYYVKNDNGLEGPFCSRCYDENKKLVRMHKERYKYICPADNTFVSTEEQIRIKRQDDEEITKNWHVN